MNLEAKICELEEEINQLKTLLKPAEKQCEHCNVSTAKFGYFYGMTLCNTCLEQGTTRIPVIDRDGVLVWEPAASTWKFRG